MSAFLRDFQVMRQQHGSAGYKALARQTGLSHGSVHAALKQDGKLPSVYVLEAMIHNWDPEAVSSWLARRAALATPTPDPEQERLFSENDRAGVEGVDTPRWNYRPRTWTWVASAIASALAGVGLAAPMHVGGVDVWDYCVETYGDDVASPPAEATARWDSWTCRLGDGRREPVDMMRACALQHQPMTPLGRTYADHSGPGAGSWRCYVVELSVSRT